MSSKKSTTSGGDTEKNTGLTSSQKKVRLPVPGGTIWFKDKSKYDRKKKHAKEIDNTE